MMFSRNTTLFRLVKIEEIVLDFQKKLKFISMMAIEI